jgi:hypothetical protein
MFRWSLARQDHNVPLTIRYLCLYHTVRAQYCSKLPKSSVSRLGSSISAPLGNYSPACSTVLPGHNITAKATLEHGAEGQGKTGSNTNEISAIFAMLHDYD